MSVVKTSIIASTVTVAILLIANHFGQLSVRAECAQWNRSGNTVYCIRQAPERPVSPPRSDNGQPVGSAWQAPQQRTCVQWNRNGDTIYCGRYQ